MNIQDEVECKFRREKKNERKKEKVRLKRQGEERERIGETLPV